MWARYDSQERDVNGCLVEMSTRRVSCLQWSHALISVETVHDARSMNKEVAALKTSGHSGTPLDQYRGYRVSSYLP